ncbi:MAG TPA: 5-oxoprolinase subunit PxpA [Rhodanobacteraceae bacterium]|nr:5-oxoprolinase subunit PxpA [Rhodanobacteraceae bacterium]
MASTIDLNADIGESFGAWRMGDDAGVMPWITSANVACGFHAGDPAIMRATVALCIEHGVAIGAHVSLPDLQGFGRREMKVSSNDVYAQTLYQLGALHAFVRAAGTHLHHVKPHGALYNMAARDRALAYAIAAAVRDFNSTLILMGLAGSALVDAGRAAGLRVQCEGFCDRRYRADGSLTPRSEAGAVIEDIDAAVAQALSIATAGEAAAGDGSTVRIQADSLCVHGDRANAAAFAERLHRALAQADVRIMSAARPT